MFSGFFRIFGRVDFLEFQCYLAMKLFILYVSSGDKAKTVTRKLQAENKSLKMHKTALSMKK